MHEPKDPLHAYWRTLRRLEHPIWQRVFEVAVAVVVGLLVDATFSRTREVGAALTFLALTGITLLAGAWWILGLVNLILLVAWYRGWAFWRAAHETDSAATRRPVRGFVLRLLRVCVEFANRYVGHIDALLAWVTFALVWGERLGRQVAAVVAVVRLGSHLVDLLADVWTLRSPPTATHDLAPEAEPLKGELVHVETRNWRRRPIYYLLTVLGLITLIGVAGVEQAVKVLPLVAVVGISTAIRLFLWSVRQTKDGLVQAERTQFYAWAHRIDWLAGAVAMGVALYVPINGLEPEAKAAVEDHRDRREHWTACGEPTPASPSAPVTLFIVSDSQFHDLTGSRSGVHVDLVDAVVPVAVRPVELDLLSGVTLARFARMYRSTRAEQKQRAKWMHLGDFADLGCVSELERFGATFAERFGGGLVALVPGNHDSTFFGNFEWHPDWRANCPTTWSASGRLTKPDSDRRLRAISEQRGASAEPSPSGSSYLAGVGELGNVGTRKVVGVFLDTSDYGGPFHVGVAGVFGGVSKEQLDWATEQLEGEANRDAWLVVFMHHPYESVKDRYWLDAFLRKHHDRVLGIAAAHTHLAALRQIPELGLEEIIVGSTIDPPQEAALLEVDGGDKPFLRVRTLPAVARAGATCVDGQGVPADRCRRVQGRLAARPQCQALLGKCALDAPKCEGLVDPPGTKYRDLVPDCWPSLHDCRTLNPATPGEIKYLQSKRAWRLLKCIQKKDAVVEQEPLAAKSSPMRWVDELLQDPDTVEEGDAAPDEALGEADLVCLSWAASILQGHKAQGWGYDQALDFAFESAATYGAKVMVTKPRAR